MQTDEEVGKDGPVPVTWTPLGAAAWIKSGGAEPAFSDAFRDLRWVWKDTGPGPRDEKEFRLAFDCYANEQNGWAGRQDARNDSGDSNSIPEITLLKTKLITGAIGASGLPKGAGPRVVIPAIEWADLDFMGEEADTAWSRNGVVYTGVRLLRDDILKSWPKRTTLETVLRDAANQNGGTLTQKGATKIARDHGVYTNRDELRAALERLGIKDKQGRKRNTP